MNTEKELEALLKTLSEGTPVEVNVAELERRIIEEGLTPEQFDKLYQEYLNKERT